MTKPLSRADLTDVSRRGRAIFVGSVGNLVEWYDFYASAAFALYFPLPSPRRRLQSAGRLLRIRPRVWLLQGVVLAM